jgi:putative endonuclease
MKNPCVYLLASRRNGTLYIEVTSNLLRRVHEHRTDAVPGFTRKYQVHSLVWFEQHATLDTAIAREKAMRNGNGHGRSI